MMGGWTTIEQAVARVRPLDERAMAAARERQDQLLKPRGSLGELEELSIRVAGITGSVRDRLERKVHFLFGSDHGVYDQGVSGSPQDVTRALMVLYARGGQCAINVLCRQVGVELRLFDLGVKGLGPTEGIDASYKLMPDGTADFSRGRAMPIETARRAVELGVHLVEQAKAEGQQIIGAGEVGMGNTTPAAACIMACVGSEDEALVGRGGGLTEEAFERKKRVVVEALRMHQPDRDDPLDVLSCVGGLDIAAMTGAFVGAAACRLPIVIDGAISIAAALLASKLCPGTTAYMIASHRSAEPAYAAAAEALGVRPMLELGMRLGEGSGCPLAMQVVDAALAIMDEMGTFADVSIESEYREELVQ